jgi:WD40 repeat protein
MTDAPAQAEPATPSADTPFVGLVPYGEEDAAFFFGRDEETRIVAGNLRASGLTLLYGASGVGKTSLLRAGVVHDLHDQVRANERRVRPRRAPFALCVFSSWRDDPLGALMATIGAAGAEALGGDALPAWEPGDSVADTLRSWTERVRTFLVVLDQFEDYFLYHPDEDGEGTFADELPRVVNDPNLRVHFLLSIREDALAKLDRFKGYIPRLFANYVRIEHLDRAAARRAIEGPVEEWDRRLPAGERPFTLEPALVERVIDAAAGGGLVLGRAGSEPPPDPAERERVEAPFLQLVMERLWRATVAAGDRELTTSRLEQLGGAQQIVENHLLEALGALGTEEQAVAADLFRFLVTRSKTKIAHAASDLAEWTGRPEPEVTAVLERLCRGEGGRILRQVPPPPTGSGGMRYELFHDVLAEPILEWRREHEEERKRRAAYRRLVRVGGSLLSIAAVFAALGIWALVQRSEAQSATRSATSFALASAAREELGSSLPNSLLLGLEAYRASPSAEAASALVAAFEQARRSGAEMILRGGRDGVRAIAFSPDGSTLASADLDGSLHLWDTGARKTLGEPLLGHTGEVWSLAFSPDGTTLASAGLDGTIRLWDAADGSTLGAPIEPGRGGVRSVAFSPDGRVFAATAPDDTIRLFDAESRRQVGRPLRGHEREVVSIAFSPDGRMLVSGGYDRTVRVWDVGEREQLAALRGHTGEVWAVAFGPDASTVASGDREGSVRLWDVASRRPLGRPLDAPRDEVWGVAFSPDGRTLASASFDDTVRLWDARSGAPLGLPLRGHTSGVISVRFRPDGLLASASFDGTIRLWDPTRRTTFGVPLLGHADRVKSVVFGVDDQLASAGFDGEIRLWDPQSGRVLRELDSGADSLESVAVSPDGETLASAGGDGTIGLWRISDGRAIGQLLGHQAAVQSVAFGPDGRTLASGGFDGTVRLWDIEELEQRGDPLEGHEGPVWSVALGGNGRLASAGSDGTLLLWDVEERTKTGELPLPGGDVPLSVAFASDGTLASGSVGGLVQLWDPENGQAVGEPLRGHRDRVASVAFSPDGAILASASDDGTVRLWHVAGRRALGTALGDHEGRVLAVAFARDGGTFASGGDDRTVRRWDGILWRNLADLEETVCSLVVRNLTEPEWRELAPGIPYRTTCAT